MMGVSKTIFFIAVFICAFSALAYENNSEPQKIASHLSSIHKITGRFVYSPNSETSKIFCSGVFINPTTILTAGHCFENLSAQDIKNSFFELPQIPRAITGEAIAISQFKIQSVKINTYYQRVAKILKYFPVLYYSLQRFYKKYDSAIVKIKGENSLFDKDVQNSFRLETSPVLDSDLVEKNLLAYSFDSKNIKNTLGVLTTCLTPKNKMEVIETLCSKPFLKGNSGSPIFEDTPSGIKLIAIAIGKITQGDQTKYIFSRPANL